MSAFYRARHIAFGRDLAGVPFIVYAIMSSAIPVLFFTFVAILLLSKLYGSGTLRQGLVVVVAAAAGATFGLPAGVQGALPGFLTGAACGLVDLVLWRAMKRRQPVQNV